MEKICKRLGVLLMAAFMVPLIFSFKAEAAKQITNLTLEPGQTLRNTLPGDGIHSYSFNLPNTVTLKISTNIQAKGNADYRFTLYDKNKNVIWKSSYNQWTKDPITGAYDLNRQFDLTKGSYILAVENESYSTARSYNVKVTTSDVSDVSYVKLKVKKGSELKLGDILYTNGTITWSTGNKKIATVSKAGVVKGVKKGNTTITAYSKSKKEKIIIKLYVI